MKRAIVAVVLVVATSLWYVTRAEGATANYRVATAVTRDIAESLAEVGTVEPVSAAKVSFAVGGTVASVHVTRGQAVARGQTLATLDTSELDDAVDEAQAKLDQAKAALAEALAASADAKQGDDTVALDEARQGVLDGQRLVDEKLTAAQAALESANAVCSAVTEESVGACQAALSEVLRAQSETADAQAQLTAASNTLEQLRNLPRTGAGSRSVGAAQLVALQKEIDAAATGVAVARHNVSAATIVSPLEGTVADVGVAVGDVVTAQSSTSTVHVVGPAGFEVTAIVSVDDLRDVKIGQRAVVRPDGIRRAVEGEVVTIGAPRVSNGSTTYPVSIGVADDSALHHGTVASVAIITGTATAALAVPTSAVHVEGNRKTVTMLRRGKAVEVIVQVGVIGRTWTQITSGLRPGTTVVLANLDEALPGSATTSRNGGGVEERLRDGGAVVEFAPGGGTAPGPGKARSGP